MATRKSRTKAPHDLLKDMLHDVNQKLHAITDVIATVQAHGDLYDEHLELTRRAKKLAKEAHTKLKDAK